MLKRSLIALAIVASAPAFAASFDDYVGKYTVASAPVITNQNTKWCDRFAFSRIVGLDVFVDRNGYKQSHMLYLKNPNGWSGHPIMEYRDVNEIVRDAYSYARTTSSGDLVQNEWGSFYNGEDERLTVSLQKQGSNYVLRMREELFKRGQVESACYYEVKLSK